jgi:hypothetical protein
MALKPTCLLAQEPRAAVLAPVVGKARRLPGKYGAKEPTLAADALGNVLIVADGGINGRREPRIILWRSEDSSRTWLQPSYLRDSKEFGTYQGDPWLQSDGPGKFSIVYMGSSGGPFKAAFQRSKDGGKTWVEPRGFHHRGQADKTVMAVSPNGKEFVVVFSINSEPDGGNGVQLHRSRDQGKTWQEVPFTRTWKGPSAAFGLVVSDAGAIAIGWWVFELGRHVLSTTTNGGKDWLEAKLSASRRDFKGGKDKWPSGYEGPALALDGAGRAHAVSVQLENRKGKRDLLLRSTSDFRTWS